MKINLISALIITASIATLSSCGGKSNNQSSANDTEIKKAEDSTITGSITKMSALIYQGTGSYYITVDNNKNDLWISTDFLGDNGACRIFINPEAKDILILNKEKFEDRLNLKYLNKNIKATFNKKNFKISKLELVGGDKAINQETKTIKGFILGLDRDKKSGDNYIKLKKESGELENIRLYLDKSNHYTVTSVYRGEGKKSNYVFYIDNYALSLTPDNMNRKVNITCSIKLVTDTDIDSNEGRNNKSFHYENVITEVEWVEKENKNEQVKESKSTVDNEE